MERIFNRIWGQALLLLRLLMVAFIILVGIAWARGLDVTCGCFGSSDSAPNYPLWIGRNLAILGALVVVARWQAIRPTGFMLDRRSNGH